MAKKKRFVGWTILMLWMGPIIVFTGAVTYFTVFYQFPALRDFPWVNLPIVLVGLLLSWRMMRNRLGRGAEKRIASIVMFLISLSLAAVFNWYVFYYSYQLPNPSERAVGASDVIDFELFKQDGKLLRLSDYRGRKVLLVFYRGHW